MRVVLDRLFDKEKGGAEGFTEDSAIVDPIIGGWGNWKRLGIFNEIT